MLTDFWFAERNAYRQAPHPLPANYHTFTHTSTHISGPHMVGWEDQERTWGDDIEAEEREKYEREDTRELIKLVVTVSGGMLVLGILLCLFLLWALRLEGRVKW
jgi:hypothetical protein